MNKTKDGEVNATDVGRHFLTKYYNAMATDVEQVIHFYSDSSNVKRFGNSTVCGIENIKTELAKHRLDNMSVRVYNIVCLNSLNDSIVIQVSGEFVQQGGEGRAFIQNVILASQGPGKYYIYSDMIEWLADLYPSLNFQEMKLSEESHYNNQNAQSVHPNHSEPLYTQHEIQQNGQLHSSSLEQQHGHQGTNVGNIQSFINAAASHQAPKVEDQQVHFKTTKEQTPPQKQPEPTAQKPILTSVQIPEDTGPRTWAKLVSGQIKSNGLPPPTQPPPATVEPFQSMGEKKIKTQHEFQQVRGGNNNGDKQPRQRRQGAENRGEGRGNNNGDRGDKPFRPRRQGTESRGNGNSERPPRRNTDQPNSRGDNGNNYSKSRRSANQTERT